ERLSAREDALVAASPQAILQRGYALITDRATGQRIKSVDQAAAGRDISLQFHDGSAAARLTAAPTDPAAEPENTKDNPND
ncbi:MAG: exodeoxyribonuclease VII large subunit, partial [Chloroflexi bacterium]|nr:exodeoxyribonuclease VII large subunit [Chloroflexota bacterium]